MTSVPGSRGRSGPAKESHIARRSRPCEWAAPYVSTWGREGRWRLGNAAVGAWAAARGWGLWGWEADWWLWGPMYGTATLLALAVAVGPSVVERTGWRLLTALFIVSGLSYVLYTAAVLWELLSGAEGAFVRDPADLVEGRELATMALLVGWAVLARSTAPNQRNLYVHVRLGLFCLIWLVCAVVFVPSLCFFTHLSMAVPACRAIFANNLQ